MGVFATRSPFRPNPLGLTCVKLEGIELSGPQGPLLRVAGADLMDGTPIFDIKPYIPYADCHPEATGGFTDGIRYERLDVDFPEALLGEIPLVQSIAESGDSGKPVALWSDTPSPESEAFDRLAENTIKEICKLKVKC